MVIASGRSSLQVKALADDVDEALAMEGITLRAREGTGEGRWIVLDYGTVLVHIFHPEDRQFYHLERLWEDGQNRIALPFMDEEGVKATNTAEKKADGKTAPPSMIFVPASAGLLLAREVVNDLIKGKD